MVIEIANVNLIIQQDAPATTKQAQPAPKAAAATKQGAQTIGDLLR
jgi:hypothetical protein